MKPPSFQLTRATSVAECLDALASQDLETKVIAGGQSLMPLMNLRLARPERLVDINRIAELEGLDIGSRECRIGALVRHRTLETSSSLKTNLPIIPRVASHIGHLAIRNRGTLGGTLAHADAAAELPALMTLLEADLVVRSAAQGVRHVPIGTFFVAPLTTTLSEDELLTEVSIPRPTPFEWHGFFEYATRAGDFARVAALLKLQASGGDDLSEVLAIRYVLFGSEVGALRFLDQSTASGALPRLTLGHITRDETALPRLAAGLAEQILGTAADDPRSDGRLLRRWAQVVTARAASELVADVRDRGGPSV